MLITLFKVAGVIALPIIVFLLAGLAMMKITGRGDDIERLRAEGMPPLNMRYFGYDRKAFGEFYTSLGENGRKTERAFLLVDLIFPFFYGGALAISLLLAWWMLDRPFNAAWIFLPVAIAVAADWTENLIHLAQLDHIVTAGVSGLSTFWIGTASIATIIKIWLLVGSSLSLLWLCGRLILTSASSPTST